LHSHKPVVWYKGFLYQAASWKTARRVVAKVEHHAGELFPRVGFIMAKLTLPSRAVVRFYNKGGTSEQWIKEGKQAVKMTRLSCHRFRSNEVRLWRSAIAYNPGEPVAAAGAAEGNRQVVADQPIAAAGEDGRPVGEACPTLLALAGGEPPDAPPLRVEGAADRILARANGIGRPPTEPRSVTTGRRKTERCQRCRSN
jgi:Transposase DDE domain group 1